MTEYLIFFNQQWVGDHSDEWFAEPRPHLARRHRRHAGGGRAGVRRRPRRGARPGLHADDTSGALVVTDGPYSEAKEWLGGLTIVDVDTEEQARYWGGRIAEGCGWPQEVRAVKPGSMRG